MRELKLLIYSIENAMALVEVTSKSPCHVDIHSGQYAVDGSSLLGVLSIDLTRKMTCKIISKDENAIEDLVNNITNLGIVITD